MLYCTRNKRRENRATNYWMPCLQAWMTGKGVCIDASMRNEVLIDIPVVKEMQIHLVSAFSPEKGDA